MTQEQQDILRTLEAEAYRMAEVCSEIPVQEPVILVQRIGTISTYIARCAKMLADAEYIVNVTRGEALEALLEKSPKISANQQKMIVDSRCAYAIKVHTLVEQTYKSLVHVGDLLRTPVSYAKTEMQNLKYLEG